MTTASIMSSIIGAVVKLPIAKMIDIWGRPQGYLVMIVVATIGNHTIPFFPANNPSD